MKIKHIYFSFTFLIMQSFIPLEPDRYYHIYNRGINGEDIFKKEANYAYFLQLYSRYIEPVADTFSYCLLKNHFHLLIRVKPFSGVLTPSGAPSPDGVSTPENNHPKQLNPSRQFGHLFNSYAQSINKAYDRTGSLFERPFRRILVDSDEYFCRLVYYIHANPQRHGFVKDFREYPHSSFNALRIEKPTRLRRNEVREWFGNLGEFIKFHDQLQDLGSIEKVVF